MKVTIASKVQQYSLHINDVLVTELPEAPPITKENIPEVCRSEITKWAGESRTRKTWMLFIRGEREVITIEHEKRTQ